MEHQGLLLPPHLAHYFHLFLQPILHHVQQLDDARIIVLEAAPEGQRGDDVAHCFIQEVLGAKGMSWKGTVQGRASPPSLSQTSPNLPDLRVPQPQHSLTGLVGEGGTEARGLLGHPLLE